MLSPRLGVNGVQTVHCTQIDRRALKPAITSPPPAKATATVVPPTSMAHIRHFLTEEDIKRLQPLRWLNEELILFGIR
jgi:hypothetical protein